MQDFCFKTYLLETPGFMQINPQSIRMIRRTWWTIVRYINLHFTYLLCLVYAYCLFIFTYV